MTDISIERNRLPAARKLVWRVFRHQTLPERLSSWAIANRDSWFVRRLTAWAGVDDFPNLQGAIAQQTGSILKTTGLYTYTRDAAEAVWLAWFYDIDQHSGVMLA